MPDEHPADEMTRGVSCKSQKMEINLALLSQLNQRERLYMSRMWQAALAYVGIVGVTAAGAADKKDALGYLLVGLGVVGVLMVCHHVALRLYQKKANEKLRAVEGPEGLGIREEWQSDPTTSKSSTTPLLIILVLVTLACYVVGASLLGCLG